ncbi:hypothetical protein [Pedobacter sp. UYP30]|uniref:hypothetical protein n=1 Tax=Pedobacter sp. UYP30 TaxID=1756400 RepID=UPI003393AD4A
MALLAASFLIMMFTLYFSEKHLTDLRGRFTFSEHRFEISSQFINQIITHNSIESISRQHYDIVFLLGTRAIPSQFRIVCADGENIVFRIARSEEKRYMTSVKKISREIYKTNRLGVHFASKFKKELSTVNEKDKLFDKIKPVPHYSLEKAINLLLEKTNLILGDFTIEKTN